MANVINMPGGKLFVMSILASKVLADSRVEIRHSPTMISEPSQEDAVKFGLELAEKMWPAVDGWEHDVVAVELNLVAETMVSGDGTVNVVMRPQTVGDA